MPRILVTLGTRPEAIKLCPVIRRLSRPASGFDVEVCVTGQHREMLDQALAVFGVQPAYDLDVMRPGQTLAGSAGRILTALEPVLEQARPDLALVQGDTTSAFCAALAAFYRRIPVGHIEAGLRTGDRFHPFPAEMNRILIGRLASLHFAATVQAAVNLEAEGVPASRVFVTGNTGVDAVLSVASDLDNERLERPVWPWLDPRRRLILVTAHRRESFGDGFESICDALLELSRRPDVQIAYPVHPNPAVREAVNSHLGRAGRIRLLEPLDYVSFVDLMSRSYLILTDSGGIQEEAPALQKPIFVLRETTERPEAVAVGASKLVGRRPEQIVSEVAAVLDNPAAYARMASAGSPYGDGAASSRIATELERFFGPRSLRLGASEAVELDLEEQILRALPQA